MILAGTRTRTGRGAAPARIVLALRSPGLGHERCPHRCGRMSNGLSTVSSSAGPGAESATLSPMQLTTARRKDPGRGTASAYFAGTGVTGPTRRSRRTAPRSATPPARPGRPRPRPAPRPPGRRRRPSRPAPRAASCGAGRTPRRPPRRPPCRGTSARGGSRRVKATSPESTLGTGQNTLGGTLPAGAGVGVPGELHRRDPVHLGAGAGDQPVGDLLLHHHQAVPQASAARPAGAAPPAPPRCTAGSPPARSAPGRPARRR